MHSTALEQRRAASNSGGVSSVTLEGRGGAFLVQIATRSGGGAAPSQARSSERRRFGNPMAALSLLRDLGITAGQFDASEWNPTERAAGRHDDAKARVLHRAHEDGAYAKWLAAEIADSIDDPRPIIPHDRVMSRMDDRIARHTAAGEGRT